MSVVLMTLHSCRPLDLSAEYKDITISYAILNPNDEVHYFKVYKGFLTDGNAYEAAQTRPTYTIRSTPSR